MPGASGRGRKRTRTVESTNVKSIEKKVKTDAEDTPSKQDQTKKVSHRSHSNERGCVLSVGEGDTGQLGLGPDIMEKAKPGKVTLPDDVVQVCAGGMHTLCLTAQGQVYSFGCNDEGALGRITADEDECMEPGEVALDCKVVQLSAGDSHSAAITEDGKVFAWGTFRDCTGRIGLTPDGTVHSKPTSIELINDTAVVKISSGTDHLVCLTDDGEIYTLGCAEQGQLGRVAECFSTRGGRKGLDLLLKPAPVHFRKRSLKFCDVWTGQYMTYAQVKDTGEIYAWGLNNYYQLGFSDMKNRFVPEKCKSFAGKATWKEISGGQHHTIALDSEGRVYALGRKEYGRLGLGEENLEEKREPTLVETLDGKKCVRVNAGTAVSYAVTDDGEVYAWGMGSNKQLSQTEEDDVFSPIKMIGKQLERRRSLMVSAGGQHTVLLAQDQ